MDTRFSEEDLAFQAEVRQFYKDNYTAEVQANMANLATYKQAQIDWQKLLYEKGWVAPGWPKEYGGTGWTATQNFIFSSERSLAGAPDVIPFGLKMVGPVIYTFGNDAQKEQFLPRILNSEDWWCQGYSEPGAGSDLASLKTRADIDGDHYVVNGAKIWTSYAQHADWIFCLVRTSNEGKKQQGISFLLIDMNTPGIKVNPIVTIDNYHSLNEVEFNDVRVPISNRIGEQDQGWTYAKALLAHERTSIAQVADSKKNLAQVIQFAGAENGSNGSLLSDPRFQQQVSDIEMDLMALEFTELRVLAALSSGSAPGPESSLLKIKGTEIQQAIQELRMQVAGTFGGVLPGDDGSDVSGHEFGSAARQAYMYGRATTIYGGSNEVQKNIISKAVLGLE